MNGRRSGSFAGLAVGCCIAAVVAGGLQAQEDGEFERVQFRVVSSATPDAIVIDRGASDGIEAGDLVFFQPRSGGSYRGTVVKVEQRSAIVRTDAREVVPAPGTRGSARVPRARRPREPDAVPREPAGPVPSDDPKTEPRGAAKPLTRDVAEEWRRDDGWRPGMPLLAQVRAVRPADRQRSIHGRVYMIGALTHDDSQDFDNSFARVGTEVHVDNPFGVGGGFHFDGELDYRTERDESRGFDLLPRRLSYHVGGTRFEPRRFEFGRFLQTGMPEFGVLDGAEVAVRREGGDRFGFSVGYLPELDEDFESLQDLQFAGHYHWFADTSERTMLSAGYQKTFHNGDVDRDLFVLKGRHLPLEEGWRYFGTAWIDLYAGKDDIKGKGVEFTQLLLSAERDWQDAGGLDVTYRRITFPEMLRDEFLPLPPEQLRTDFHDRLTVGGWRPVSATGRVRGLIGGWNDERDSGGVLELGLESDAWPSEQARSDATLFVTRGSHSTVIGGRMSLEIPSETGRYDLFYELANHHFDGFADDIDDMLQHRLRASRSFRTDSGWDMSFYAQLHAWDEELSWSLGFFVQRRFQLSDS